METGWINHLVASSDNKCTSSEGKQESYDLSGDQFLKRETALASAGSTIWSSFVADGYNQSDAGQRLLQIEREHRIEALEALTNAARGVDQ